MLKAVRSQRQNHLIGAGLMVLSVLFFTALDATMKFLVGQHDLWALAWARNAAQLLYLTALLPLMGVRKTLAVERPVLQILRGACLAGMTIAVLVSLSYMTLTQTYVAMLSSPLVAAALAGPMLAEHVTARQWFWILAGFIGVVIALDPGAPDIGAYLVYAAAMALCFGAYQVLTRLGARVESSMTQLYYVALISVVILTFGLFMAEETLPSSAWGWVCLAAAFGTVAHFLLIQAFSFAPPAIVSPMIYVQVIWAVIVGYLVFGEVPTWGTIAGAVIVAFCGIVIVRGGGR